MIGKSGERGSGISVLAARHDDDDTNLTNNFRCISTRRFKDVVPKFLLFIRNI